MLIIISKCAGYEAEMNAAKMLIAPHYHPNQKADKQRERERERVRERKRSSFINTAFSYVFLALAFFSLA